MEDERALVGAPALDTLAADLAPDPLYVSPGGRRFLLAASLIAGVPRGARVLDVGCGPGRYCVELAAGGAAEVVGVDLAPGMLAIAARLAAERGVESRCRFVRADVLD